MKKDRIILKTHGVNSSKEVGLIVLPKAFYIKVNIENCGDFDVELRDGAGEQLFSVCHHIKGIVKSTAIAQAMDSIVEMWNGNIKKNENGQFSIIRNRKGSVYFRIRHRLKRNGTSCNSLAGYYKSLFG